MTAVSQEDVRSVRPGGRPGEVIPTRHGYTSTADRLEAAAPDGAWAELGWAARSGTGIDDAELQKRLWAAERRADSLERGLMSNRRIGMAIGVLLTVRHLTDQQAFEALRQESMRRNVKLRDLAEEVIYTGTL
jgi:hypothetical protein